VDCPYWSHKFSLIQNYGILYETLDEIGEETHGEPAAKALRLQAQMTKFAVYFGLKFSEVVFSAAEQLSAILQSHDILQMLQLSIIIG